MSSLSSGSLTYQGVSFQFGKGTPYLLTDFVRGVSEPRVQDREHVRGDGARFGVDLKSGPTHELSLLVQGEGNNPGEREAAVRPLISELERVWDAPSLRARGGELAMLQVGDRFAFGRPRELVPDDSGRWDGTSNPQLSFRAESQNWYGPEERTTMRLAPVFTGGLPVAAAVPFVLGGGTGQADSIVQVGGDVATWPVFELRGPIQDPWIDVPGVGRLVFRGTLAYDQTLTVDTRPWARWVKRDGAALPGALSPAGSRLSDMAMRPGSYRVIFGGYDPSGTSTLTVRVSPAFTSF